MRSFALPRTLTLPSGARVTLRSTGPENARDEKPAKPSSGKPVFAEVLALDDAGVVRLESLEGARARFGDLPLADFHVVRAVLAKAGYVEDEEIEIDCHNCGELLKLRPCERLETGPWEDGELGDPELDATLPFGEPIDIEPIPLGRVRRASTVTFAPRTVAQAAPLFAALARSPFDVKTELIEAMGIVALGTTTEPDKIAQALADCTDSAFGSVTDAFLGSHYPLRLGADVFCSECKARNTVDAPARELEPGQVRTKAAHDSGGEPAAKALPPVDVFVELAHSIAEPLLADIPGEPVELVVEDGTPAVDDGGEPLLGSYVPPPPKDAPVPTRPPTITVYYRTFQAIERDEGPFDWEAELRETIEHELEHHVYWLRGDDPMDDAERDEIDREALRVVGRAESTRRTFAVFGASVPEFFRRAWPLVLIAAAVLAITLGQGRCTPDETP
jgi:hypothetical protein